MRAGLPECVSSFAGLLDICGVIRTRLSHLGSFQDSGVRDRASSGYRTVFAELIRYQGGEIVDVGRGNRAQARPVSKLSEWPDRFECRRRRARRAVRLEVLQQVMEAVSYVTARACGVLGYPGLPECPTRDRRRHASVESPLVVDETSCSGGAARATRKNA